MGEDNLSQICTWVYATYGVHPDLNIHTAGGISFVYILVHFNSRKQKLNKKSSTEAEVEVVGVIKYLE